MSEDASKPADEKKGGSALKIIIAIPLVLIGLFVGVGLVLPSGYAVERSVVIDADVATVHGLVGDLERWPEWEPWREEDPTITTTIAEKSDGVGAHQSWTGESGKGELTFTKSDPATGIGYDLTFDDTYKSTGEMTYATEGDGVKVTWSMKGDNGMNIIGRYFGLLMDGMVGPMFERGLEKLKTAAESGAAPAGAAGEDAGAGDAGGDAGDAGDEGGEGGG